MKSKQQRLREALFRVEFIHAICAGTRTQLDAWMAQNGANLETLWCLRLIETDPAIAAASALRREHDRMAAVFVKVLEEKPKIIVPKPGEIALHS